MGRVQPETVSLGVSLLQTEVWLLLVLLHHLHAWKAMTQIHYNYNNTTTPGAWTEQIQN